MPQDQSLQHDLHITLAATLADVRDALEVRRIVFIEEQHVPPQEEIDHHDGDPNAAGAAVHALARLRPHALPVPGAKALRAPAFPLPHPTPTPGHPDRVALPTHALDNQCIATGRLLPHSGGRGHAKIGRVAVLPAYRHRGVGVAIMQCLHAEARARGHTGITIEAQLHAIPFYQNLGYTPRGEIFLDANIPHRWMDLEFSSRM